MGVAAWMPAVKDGNPRQHTNRSRQMAKKPQAPAPQQQGGSAKPQGQMTGSNAPAPQQGQTPVIGDWASI